MKQRGGDSRYVKRRRQRRGGRSGHNTKRGGEEDLANKFDADRLGGSGAAAMSVSKVKEYAGVRGRTPEGISFVEQQQRGLRGGASGGGKAASAR